MLLLLTAFWWMRLRILCKLPDERDWWWGKLGLALLGRTLLSKALIQLSADLRLHSLLCSSLAWGNPTLGPTDSMVGLTASSKTVYTKGDHPVFLSLWWALANPHLHRRPSNTSRQFWFSFQWGLLCILVCRTFFCALQDWSLFRLVLWKSYNQIPLAFKARFPVDSQFFCQVPRLGSLGLRTFTTVQEWLWYSCSPPGGDGIWFYCDCVPPAISLRPLSLDVGYHFLLGSSILLSMVVQQLVAVLVFSQEMSAPPSALPSWTRIFPDTHPISHFPDASTSSNTF